MAKAVFYHAGCSVCVDAEQAILPYLDRTKTNVETIHFAQHPDKLDEAEKLGVKSVPALVLNGTVYHINFGASMADVRKAVGK